MEKPTGFIALCLFAAVRLGVFPVRAQDPTRVAPQVFGEKLNDEQVRVSEYKSKPRDKEPMDSHSDVVVYVVRRGKYRSLTSDGKSEDMEYKTGDVIWRSAVTHSVETISKTPHAILVEMNGTAQKK